MSGRCARSGDLGAAVDDAAELEVGLHRVGDRQRQLDDADVERQPVGDPAGRRHPAAADVERQRIDDDGAALHLEAGRLDEPCGKAALREVQAVEADAVAAFDRHQRAFHRRLGAVAQDGVGGEAGRLGIAHRARLEHGDFDAAGDDVAGADRAVDDRNGEEIGDRGRDIGLADRERVDDEAAGARRQLGILLGVLGAERDGGRQRAGCLFEKQGCGGRNVGRLELQGAGRKGRRASASHRRSARGAGREVEIAQPLLVSVTAIAEASITRTLSSVALPITWPLRSPSCSVPSKPSVALVSGLPTSDPSATSAPKVRPIRPSLPLARPWPSAVRKPARKSTPDRRAPYRSEVGLAGGEGSVGGEVELCVGDLELVGDETRRAAGDADR